MLGLLPDVDAAMVVGGLEEVVEGWGKRTDGGGGVSLSQICVLRTECSSLLDDGCQGALGVREGGAGRLFCEI